jgi:hypothetical protein
VEKNEIIIRYWRVKMYKINSYNFYSEYHGHKIEHLDTLLHGLKKLDIKNYIYLAGDSSLDNKYWLFGKNESFLKNESSFLKNEDAINGYEHILEPPEMKPDIAYHMNTLLVDSNYYVINTAVEESTIACRKDHLLAQDSFIQRHITNDDMLLVSVGGNDIALSPSLKTIWNMVLMMYCNSIETIQLGPEAAWGMKHFIQLFKNDVETYILSLLRDKRPKKIIICMIYYPDQQPSGGWADRTLGFLGYDTNPEKLQTVIQTIFNHATSHITIKGSHIIPCPMYKILDGKNPLDYVQRVEPSTTGGAKLAQEFVRLCLS